MLGALPVVAEFGHRLQIREIVDAACPVREVSASSLTHGQVIEVLVANRLTSPAPLVRVADWATAWAVPEVFGVAADALGDDRALGNWVAKDRDTRQARNGLSESEHEELLRLRKENAELAMERDALKRSVVLWVKEATK